MQQHYSLSWRSSAGVAPVGPVYQTPMDYLYQVVSVLAFGAIIGAILCLDAWQRPYPGYGRVGHIGSILASLGYAIVLLVVIINIALGGWHLTPVRIVGAVTLLVGSALLGVATLRARKMPWWCGVLLIVAFPIGDIVDGMFAGGEAIMLALLWGSVGAALWKRTDLVCSTRRAAHGCILRPPPPPHLPEAYSTAATKFGNVHLSIVAHDTLVGAGDRTTMTATSIRTRNGATTFASSKRSATKSPSNPLA